MQGTNREQSASRREFLKTTAVGGAAVAASLGGLASVHAAGSETIKVGVIGCGGRGSGAAEDVLKAAPGVEIVALGDAFKFRVDGLKGRLEKFVEGNDNKHKNKLNVQDRCFDGLDAFEKVLAADVNYVILATPPGFRPLHIQAAVSAGKNIFTEKPVCVDGTGARKVFAAYDEAQKKKLGIAAGTQRRHQKGYLETIKRIHDKELGDITAMRCYWNGNAIWFRPRKELADRGVKDSELAYNLHNWYHFLWLSGDHICEQHVHNLDVCNWAIGKTPTRAVGMGSRSGRTHDDPKVNGHIFNNFAIDFEYDNGVHMLSMCRQINDCDHNVSETLACTKGFCNVGSYTVGKAKVFTREEEKLLPSPYIQEHTDLIESIRKGAPINELKSVNEASLTAVLGRMSAYTGKPVTWTQALESKLDTFPSKLSWDMDMPPVEIPIPGKTPLI